MRKLILPFLLLPLLLSVARAQQWGPLLLGTASSGGGGGYTGPGDVVSGATAAYSCGYAYTAAYASGAGGLCDLQRTSDSATCTIKAATTGGADLTGTYCSGATVSAFCGASSGHCLVVDFIDQTGNSRTLTNTLSGTSYPLLVFNYQNSLPCVQFASGAWGETAEFAITSTSPPFTFSMVTYTAGTGSASPYYWGSRYAAGSGGPVLYGDPSNFVAMANGFNSGSSLTVTTALHAAQGTFNGAASYLNVDGTEAGPADTGTSSTQPWLVLSADVAGDSGTLADQIACEDLFYFFGFSSGQRASMNSNQHSRWGF